MIFSWRWLNRFVDTDDISPDILKEKLSGFLAEVEDIVKFGDVYKDIVVSKVLDVKEHPEADKLFIVQINIGETKVQVSVVAPYEVLNTSK